MQYIISFLEGIITFVSPCLLPMLPVYLSYFAGGKAERGKGKVFKNAVGFVLGFTVVFVLLGAFAGTFGRLLKEYAAVFNIVTGSIVVLFGLVYLGVLKINLFKGMQRSQDEEAPGFFSSVIFGIVFSIGWTPCVGAFLGSALMLASQQGSMIKGIVMLLFYSMGLGIPFVASALLIDRLRGTFDFIKRHYSVINLISGIFLILIGLLMMTGLMGSFLSILTF